MMTAIACTWTLALWGANAAAAGPAVKAPPTDKKACAAVAEKLSAINLAGNKQAIQRLKWVPSVDVARAITKLYQGQPQVRVEAEPVSNSLLVKPPLPCWMTCSATLRSSTCGRPPSPSNSGSS